MDIFKLLELTLDGIGYELVEVEQLSRGRLLRVFVDKPAGINVEDCAVISDHLSQLLAVENIDYSRLEVSSPGLDRLLKKESDFLRFKGKLVKIKLRVSLQGQKSFIGIIQNVSKGILALEVDGSALNVGIDSLEKARLVPKF